jgi:osmotically-inducible protein OsmY
VIRKLVPAVALLSAFALSSCAVAVVGAGGAIGMGAAEERGFEGSVDDTKIKTDVSAAYVDNSFGLYHDIQVDVSEGRVMLTGSVEKPETHDDAVKIAWQTAGVRQVIDEIQVTSEGGFKSGVNDAWIANKLRTQLMFDGDVKNINYTVEVENGVVYLLGIAQNQAELDRVIASARDISDVKRVINHVVLKDDPRRNTQ